MRNRLNGYSLGLLIVLGWGNLTLGATPSQVRPKDVSWEQMAKAFAATVHESSVPFDDLSLDEIPTWKESRSGMEAQREFERVRDLRFLALPEMSHFLRRIPWLYPDDGCSMRAERMAEEFEKGGFPRPKKLFIFGDLSVKTENSPSGWVYWWYHVAPVVQVSEKNIMVFDPAMNPRHPIRLKIWVQSMVGDVRNAKLALCDSTAYEPSSRCHEAPGNEATNTELLSEAASHAREDSPAFLKKEWFRLKDLGRDPRKELSDQPPW